MLRKLPGIENFGLERICEYLGIDPEPKPHRGINGAMKELEVLRKLDSEFVVTRVV